MKKHPLKTVAPKDWRPHLFIGMLFFCLSVAQGADVTESDFKILEKLVEEKGAVSVSVVHCFPGSGRLIEVSLRSEMLIANTLYKTISYSYPIGKEWTSHNVEKSERYEYTDFDHGIRLPLGGMYDMQTVKLISNSILVGNATYKDPVTKAIKHVSECAWTLKLEKDHWEFWSANFAPYGMILILQVDKDGVHIRDSITYNI
jgi:hypothetical protein